MLVQLFWQWNMQKKSQWESQGRHITTRLVLPAKQLADGTVSLKMPNISQGSEETRLRCGAILTIILLEIYCQVSPWKNLKKSVRLWAFGKITGRSIVAAFWLCVWPGVCLPKERDLFFLLPN